MGKPHSKKVITDLIDLTVVSNKERFILKSNINNNTRENQTALIEKLITEIEKVFVGKRFVVELTITSLIARGHLLIEDVPGVGKTTFTQKMAESFGGFGITVNRPGEFEGAMDQALASGKPAIIDVKTDIAGIAPPAQPNAYGNDPRCL